MKFIMLRACFVLTLFIPMFLLQGCAALKEVQDTFMNLKRLQFKLDSIVPGKLAEINLGKINQASKLSFTDGLKLTNAFAKKSLPLSFVLNLAARNPNDGTGGSSRNTSTISSLAWKLKFDGQETITGDINKPVEIPGTGQVSIIPLSMSIDLYKFFGEQGYDKILNLALAVAGQDGSTARLTLAAIPTITVAGIPIQYPGELNIIDKEFTNP